MPFVTKTMSVPDASTSSATVPTKGVAETRANRHIWVPTENKLAVNSMSWRQKGNTNWRCNPNQNKNSDRRGTNLRCRLGCLVLHPDQLKADGSPWLAEKFFNAVCARLGTKLLTTTDYNPQTNGQTEGHSKTILSQLLHYVSGHQNSWGTIVQLLTYAYNVQMGATTKTTSLILALTKKAPPASELLRPSHVSSKGKR